MPSVFTFTCSHTSHWRRAASLIFRIDFYVVTSKNRLQLSVLNDFLLFTIMMRFSMASFTTSAIVDYDSLCTLVPKEERVHS